MTLKGFDAKAEGGEVDASVVAEEFERFYRNVMPHLAVEQASSLVLMLKDLGLLPVGESSNLVSYGADYDITVEVENLISAVRAMRKTVIDEHGEVKKGVTPSEVRQMVTSTTSLMTLLMKSHEQLMSMDRQRALEQSTVAVLKDIGGEEIVDTFVKMMEARLEED